MPELHTAILYSKTKELLPSHHTPLVDMGMELAHVDIPLQYDVTTATKTNSI